MSESNVDTREISARRVVGFACNQTFSFMLLYASSTSVALQQDLPFNRALPFFILLSAFICFLAIRLFSPRSFSRLFSRALLYVYAAAMAAGALAFFKLGSMVWIQIIGCVFVGIPYALLLLAWGKTFGRLSMRDSVPEVFVGTLVAAFICLLFQLAGDSVLGIAVICLLPIASVVNIDVPKEEEIPQSIALETEGSQVRMLSSKILTGTVFYGISAGLLGTNLEPASRTEPMMVCMVLLGSFLIGALSLELSDGFGRGAALNKAYKLTVAMMLIGVFLVPMSFFADSVMPGEAFSLAGYLGLEAVLISLFLVMGKLTETDASYTFLLGFSALFAGEAFGILVSHPVRIVFQSSVIQTSEISYIVAFLAGILVLVSYLFLFTDRDFGELSQIVKANDSFEDVCSDISTNFGLSSRESEILAFALRGRTSDRIAQELVISKSTVDTHLRRIYGKTGVHSRQELLDLAEITRKRGEK